MEKSIYDLELHEATQPWKDFNILRVPGGWIYESISQIDGETIASVFVPFNNEFQKAGGSK
jgi:hypothetical protein